MTNENKILGLMPSFLKGANAGINTVLKVVLPNVIFAFALTQVLRLSGVLALLGNILSPVMGIFGLPGEAAFPLVLALIAFGGSLGSTASLVASGVLTGTHAFIMIPFIYLTGSIPQFTGRILSVTGVKAKHFSIIYVISFFTAVLSMFIMRLIVETGL